MENIEVPEAWRAPGEADFLLLINSVAKFNTISSPDAFRKFFNASLIPRVYPPTENI